MHAGRGRSRSWHGFSTGCAAFLVAEHWTIASGRHWRLSEGLSDSDFTLGPTDRACKQHRGQHDTSTPRFPERPKFSIEKPVDSRFFRTLDGVGCVAGLEFGSLARGSPNLSREVERRVSRDTKRTQLPLLSNGNRRSENRAKSQENQGRSGALLR